MYKQGVVYFIQQQTSGDEQEWPIKIGWTTDIGGKKRLAMVQTHTPFPCKVLALIPGSKETERDLHERFGVHKIAGEWFKPCPEIFHIINSKQMLEGADTRKRKLAMFSYKMIAFRLPQSMIRAVQQAAEERGMSMSDLIRTALQEVVRLGPQQRHHDSLLYQIAKTRAIMLRLLDTQLPKEEVDKLLAAAETDATDYVREQSGNGKI